MKLDYLPCNNKIFLFLPTSVCAAIFVNSLIYRKIRKGTEISTA
jgi:hypothetical protein